MLKLKLKKDQNYNDSKIITSELIADIFYDAAKSGEELISTREIMQRMGVKLVDRRQNKIYDLKLIRNNIAKYTDKIVEDCLSK